MTSQRFKVGLVSFLIALITSAVIFTIPGLIGFNRLGPDGVWVATIPPIVIGVLLFLPLYRIFCDMYARAKQHQG